MSQEGCAWWGPSCLHIPDPASLWAPREGMGHQQEQNKVGNGAVEPWILDTQVMMLPMPHRHGGWMSPVVSHVGWAPQVGV